jgi:lysyl-tRNA synthetase, class I
MTEETTSKYWLDIAAAEITKRFPKGEIVISSGISPSASYHVGHFREILTIDALAWAVRQLGRKVTHKHVVDNFDPLRKRYDFLPEEYEQYVGQPICLIPDPFEKCRSKHKTYAEHFYQEFEHYAQAMGITDLEVVRSYEALYKSGAMTENIEKATLKADEVREIFARVANRELPSDWMPLQLLSKNNSYNELRFKTIDTDKKRMVCVDAADEETELDYSAGQVKLNWRLDWPARWNILGVMVEPFSAQEHGAAGGSYDTGAEFSRKIFGYEPPFPAVQYANIHMVGDNKKMSSSKGNLVTPQQALEIMPAEVLRYFVVRSKPDRTLFFDPGVGLFNLLDEYAKAQSDPEHEFKDAYRFASQISQAERTITTVPFSHLVSVYQAARENTDATKDLLIRTGYEKVVEKEFDVLKREFEFVKNWLAKYAPENVKFEVQKSLPDAELSEEQRMFLTRVAGEVEKAGQLDGEQMHQILYEAKGDLKPGQAFQAIYRVILGKDSGPKAGWFLASLDKDWLVRRLKLEA